MNLPITNGQHTIRVNECFGPTFQGEGIDIGKPCFFIRLQGCPVHCPGCDTYYTWDGSESGQLMTYQQIADYIDASIKEYPGCGVVLSGGEPLIHYRNDAFIAFLRQLKRRVQWLSVETSGYVGAKQDHTSLGEFLMSFDTIHLSPKITPCLHGRQTDEQVLTCVNLITNLFLHDDGETKLVFKFVARDEADVVVVRKRDEQFGWSRSGYPIYLMPYGIERDEVIETSIRLLPYCAKYNYTLSPRLHTILWGPKRGV